MELTLHQWYTVEEAVAAFGGGTAETFCDGQFVVLSAVVLCFGTVGEAGSGSGVPGPSCFQWRPSRLDYAPSEELPWLPEKVREVWDRSGPEVRELRQHHVFLRTAADERFLYAGPAHLGSYGGSLKPGGSGLAASFTLGRPLPREIWLRFGGYPGWEVEVNHVLHRVPPGDLEEFERLLGLLPGQEQSHLFMTRYEQDSLTLHTNSRRGWLMYLRDPADGGLYVRDSDYAGDPRAEELFQCACGIDLEFPASQALPREQAMQVAREFFRTGKLPQSVEWEEE